MKNITIVMCLMALITFSTIAGAVNVTNHSFGLDDWNVYQEVGYEGNNYCTVQLDAVMVNSDYKAYAEWLLATDWMVNISLDYNNPNSCLVELAVDGVDAEVNISVSYNVTYYNGSSVVTTFTPIPSEYTEGEGFYYYTINSTNHVIYPSHCGNTYVCSIEVINITDDSNLLSMFVAGTYSPPLSFNLTYDNVTAYAARTNFVDSGVAGICSSAYSITASNRFLCSRGTSRNCLVEVYNLSDSSVLYLGSVTSTDATCNYLPVGDKSKYGSRVLGLSTDNFFFLISALIISAATIGIGRFSPKVGLIVGVCVLDFIVVLLHWINIPTTLYFMLNAMVVLYFLATRK